MIKEPCSCGADCDYCDQGDCDGYVKPVGVRKTGMTGEGWVHCCKAHLAKAQDELGTSWVNKCDWDKPGPV